MIIKIIKNNKKDYFSKSRGFVILFAVVISSILLAIGLGVANIALKEINFSISSKDTNDAFFAADTGIECALNYDKTTDYFSNTGTQTQVDCAEDFHVFISSDPWGFSIDNLGSSSNSCANVKVIKDPSLGNTRIISYGYSKGTKINGICNPSSKSVERVLEIIY